MTPVIVFTKRELSNLDSSAVVIITRPPEIIACLKLRVATRNVFIIFDSHPRPSYPNGAGMTVSPSIEGTARRLTELLPTVDLPDSCQWEAQLLSNYSGHVFVSNGIETSTPTLWQAVLESSLAQLSMQAEIAELRSQNEFLKGEQQRLEGEVKEAERERQSSTPSSSKASTSTLNLLISTLNSFTSTLLLLPSYLLLLPSILWGLILVQPARAQLALGHLDKPPTPPSDHDDSILEAMRLQNEFDNEDRMLSAQRAELVHAGKSPIPSSGRDDSILEAMRLQNEFDKKNGAPSAQRAELAHPGKPPTLPSDSDDSILEAMRLQNEFDNEDRMFSERRAELVHAGRSPIPPSDRDDSILEAMQLQNELDKENDAPSAQRAELAHPGKSPSLPSDRDDSILEVMRLQNEFDKEDRALSAQRIELAKSAQRLFECGVCMEEMPDDSIARPDPCGHSFCRECLRGHVAARLNEHRFPILCPTCIASKGQGTEATGGTCCERTITLIIISRYVNLEVSQSLALDLGLTDEQYSIWTEMELVSFSVLLNCRKYVHGIRSSASANTGVGANGRCLWPETNMKMLRPSFVRFRTAIMRGASSVSSRSILTVQTTRVMVHWN